MNVGIICDLSYSKSPWLQNYYYAIKNLFNSVKLINSHEDLEDIDIIFIGNDHYQNHLNIWRDENFIRKCNNKKIKIFVYTSEYIHCSRFPWNLQIQQDLEKFDFLYQRMIDVNDAIRYNKKIARCSYSKHFANIEKAPEKINKCLFAGTMYPHRLDAINKIAKSMEIDVLPHGIFGWREYIYILSQYKFILSPYSNDSNTFHLKFYEALLVDSIPIHQIYSNTLDYYTKEASYPDVIYFQDPAEVPDKINNFKLERSSTKPWLEDELASFFSEHNVQIDKHEYE
jgi:hypothetical protein